MSLSHKLAPKANGKATCAGFCMRRLQWKTSGQNATCCQDEAKRRPEDQLVLQVLIDTVAENHVSTSTWSSGLLLVSSLQHVASQGCSCQVNSIVPSTGKGSCCTSSVLHRGEQPLSHWRPCGHCAMPHGDAVSSLPCHLLE